MKIEVPDRSAVKIEVPHWSISATCFSETFLIAVYHFIVAKEKEITS